MCIRVNALDLFDNIKGEAGRRVHWHIECHHVGICNSLRRQALHREIKASDGDARLFQPSCR